MGFGGEINLIGENVSKDLSKVFEWPFEGFMKGFERPFKGFSMAF